MTRIRCFSGLVLALGLGAIGAAAQTAVNINCGGRDYTATDGTNWISDYYFDGGDLLYTSDGIANSQDLALYRSARAGLYGDFAYNVPVANGSYTVTLHFAEIQYWNRGDRVFNVAINGVPVLTNFDILANTAARSAITRQFPVTVTGGSVQVAVNGVYRRGVLNGIQIAPAAAPAPPPAPSLSVSAANLSFTGTAGGANPAAQTVSVTNSGGGALTWSANSNQSWLSVTPASGANTGTLSVGTNLSGLGAGSYTGTVTVTAAGAAGSPKSIAVSLTVAAPAPALSVAPSALAFAATAGGSNPPAQSISIANTGGGTMAWSVSSDSAWLSASPASGTNAGSVTVAANAGGMAAGTYKGTITVVSAGAVGTPKTVAATLTVAPPAPALSVPANALAFSATAGGASPAAQNVSIANTGGGTMAWTAASNASWLTVSPASGTNNGTLSIGASTTGMTAGTYTGTVTISAAGVAGSPKTIAATLTVTAPAPPPTSTQPAIAINCGGSEYTATDGTKWSGDSYFNGGDLLYTGDSIANTVDLALYRSGRAGLYGDFQYSIPAQNGPYTVTLDFAEIQYWNRGDRVFNVAINGSPVLSNFDILAQVAPRTAMSRQFAVNVTGGAIVIDVTGVTRKGLLNGIQIVPAGATTAPPSLSVSATALSFTTSAGGNPSAQGILIANSGAGTMPWTATSGAAWLTVSPASGTDGGTLNIGVNTNGLTPGSYNGAVSVTGAGTTKSVAVALTVLAPPTLTTSPSALTFSASAGGANPASQTLSVGNSGSGTLSWTAASNQPWLTVSPASGTNNGAVSVGVSPAGLSAGTYTGTVSIASSGTMNSVATSGSGSSTVTVTFTVAAPPALTVSPATVSFTAAAGATATAQSIVIGNAGGGSLAWTASSNQGWLTVSPSSGSNAGTASVSANASGLAAGTYTGSITVIGAGSTKAVAVSLTVTAPVPTLSAAPTALVFTCTAGSNPAAQSVTIGGTGNPSWTAVKTQSWLTLSQTSGSGAATIAIGAAAGSLAEGTYQDTVTISSPNAAPVTVAVTLSVSSQVTAAGSGASWYVSPAGSPSGDGSMGRPWDIATALSHPATVKPGDTIWLRGGKYGDGQYNSTLSSRLVGTPVLPIIVRAYPKERAIIDAWLLVGCCDGAPDPAAGSYTWFWGLEFASYNPNRTSGTSGPPEWAFMYNHEATDIWGAGTKFINCIVHDTAGGLSVWNAAGTELNGNIVFNIGGYGTDRGHGHDFYLQNAAPSVLTVTDNIGFNGFDMGLQAYGSSDAPVQNMKFGGNIVFNSGVLYGSAVDNLTLGGGNGGPRGMTLDGNHFYFDPNVAQGYNELGFLWTPRATNGVVTNNYFIGGKQAIDLERWDGLTFQNNTVYTNTGDETMLVTATGQSTSGYLHSNNRYFGTGQFTIVPNCDYWPCSTSRTVNFATWMALTGLDTGSTYTSGAPTGVWTSVRPNQYEPGRANVVIYNWDLKPSVTVDLSGAGIKIGDAYQIRDAENWFNGAVVSGTYTGAAVTIPMSGLTVVQPFGSIPYAPSHTAPQFGVFVVLSGKALNVY